MNNYHARQLAPPRCERARAGRPCCCWIVTQRRAGRAADAVRMAQGTRSTLSFFPRRFILALFQSRFFLADLAACL